MHFGCRANDEHALVVDFGAMDFSTPLTTLPSSIGNGVTYISKFISSRLSGKSDNANPFLHHLKSLNYKGEVTCFYKYQFYDRKRKELISHSLYTYCSNLQNLMINESLDTVEKLQSALITAEEFASSLPKDTPYQKFEQRSP